MLDSCNVKALQSFIGLQFYYSQGCQPSSRITVLPELTNILKVFRPAAKTQTRLVFNKSSYGIYGVLYKLPDSGADVFYAISEQ